MWSAPLARQDLNLSMRDEQEKDPLRGFIFSSLSFFPFSFLFLRRLVVATKP